MQIVHQSSYSKLDQYYFIQDSESIISLQHKFSESKLEQIVKQKEQSQSYIQTPSFFVERKCQNGQNSLIQLKQRIHMGIVQKLLKNYSRLSEGYKNKRYKERKVNNTDNKSQIVQLDQKFMLSYDIGNDFEQNQCDRWDKVKESNRFESPMKERIQKYITIVHMDNDNDRNRNKQMQKMQKMQRQKTSNLLHPSDSYKQQNSKSSRSKYKKLESMISVKYVQKISSQYYCNLEGQALENFYDIGDLIKKTEFGEHYKVIYKPTKKERQLIKVSYQNARKKVIKQFLTQSIIMDKIDHPYVIKLYEKMEEQNCLYLITEYFQGQDLFEKVIKEKCLSESLTAIYLKQILSILKYFHQKNLIHRDLRLEIFQLITESELSNLKLTDLLNMRFLPKSGYLTNLKGSPYYIAPEVLNKKYDQKCDLWSVGVMLYIMLIGRPPVKGSDQQILNRLKVQPDVLKDNDIQHLSSECQDLLNKLLQVDPNKRISAKDALNHSWIVNNNINEPLNKQALVNMANYKVTNKLNGAILNLICNQLVSESEKYKISNVFKNIDVSNNGYLSQNDLLKVYTDVYKDQNKAQKVVKSIIDNLGIQDQQKVKYSQIITAISNKPQLINRKNIIQVFNIFDKNQNGYISLSEINQVLGGNQMFDDLWNQIFIEKGQTEQNEMKLTEFVDYICKQIVNKQ